MLDDISVNYSHYVNSCCILCSRSSQTILQKATKLPYRTVHNITCKEFLAYDICTHLDDGQQGIKSKKNCQIFLLVLEIPLVLFERIPLTNHIFVAVYNVLHLRNSFIQPVSHARCHTLMKDNESVSIPPRKAPIESHAWLLIPYAATTPFQHFKVLSNFVIWQFSFSVLLFNICFGFYFVSF